MGYCICKGKFFIAPALTGINTGSEVAIPAEYWGKSQYTLAVNKDTQAPSSQLNVYRFALTVNKSDEEFINALQCESNTSTPWNNVEKTVEGLTVNFKLTGNITNTDGYKITRNDGGDILPGLRTQIISVWKDYASAGQPTSYGVWENGSKIFPL